MNSNRDLVGNVNHEEPIKQLGNGLRDETTRVTVVNTKLKPAK